MMHRVSEEKAPVFTVRLCEAYTHGIAIDVCLSVRPSVCLSVKRVYCNKTKAPSKKVQL